MAQPAIARHGSSRIVAEKKVANCPNAITGYLTLTAPDFVQVGLETGPLAVWLWSQPAARRLPTLCIDVRHANVALEMRPVKTDRNDAAGLAQNMRTSWLKKVRIKSRDSYEVRSILVAREMLVRIRVRQENEIRGLLRTFDVLFGERVGGFTGRTDEIIAGELDASTEMRLIAETLMKAGASTLDQIKVLDRRLMTVAEANPTARLFMTVPGVGVITTLSVALSFDDASRFQQSSSAGVYLRLTPRRYESGETSRNGCISKQGSLMTSKHLYEGGHDASQAQHALLHLKAWGLKLAKASGFKKARIAVTRKMAVILYAMWKTNIPILCCQWSGLTIAMPLH